LCCVELSYGCIHKVQFIHAFTVAALLYLNKNIAD